MANETSRMSAQERAPTVYEIFGPVLTYVRMFVRTYVASTLMTSLSGIANDVRDNLMQ